jgi:hypothetical protein
VHKRKRAIGLSSSAVTSALFAFLCRLESVEETVQPAPTRTHGMRGERERGTVPVREKGIESTHSAPTADERHAIETACSMQRGQSQSQTPHATRGRDKPASTHCRKERETDRDKRECDGIRRAHTRSHAGRHAYAVGSGTAAVRRGAVVRALGRSIHALCPPCRAL